MKKLFSLMLAMLMLVVPTLGAMAEDVIGGADGETAILVADNLDSGALVEDAVTAGRRVTMNFTIPEISVPATDEYALAVLDLLAGLGLNVSMQGDEYGIGLTLSEKELLTLGWAVNGKDAYINSNLFGGTIVLSAVEIEPLVGRLLDMLALMGALPEEEVQAIKAELPAMMEQLTAAFEQGAQAVLTNEDLENLDFTAFEKIYRKLLIDLEEVEEIVVPRMCDMATSGVRLSLDNEEFVEVVASLFHFIKDNPKLMNYLAKQAGIPTDAEVDQMWAAYGQMYIQAGLCDDEAGFRATFTTITQMLDQMLDMVNEKTLINGEFVTTVYFNDDEQVVYLTSVLPLFTENEGVVENAASDELNGVTEILNVVYSRQTVAQGVSHVCTIDMDGEGANIDLLAQENAWTVVLGDIATQEALLTVQAAKDENGVVTGDFHVHQGGAEGSFSCAHAADDTKIKTDIFFEMKTSDDYVTAQPNENGMSLTLNYNADYAINGVDFSGYEQVKVTVDDMKFAVKCDIATSDPAESIMAGVVTRPAELDDSAFANWFVGMYNSINAWVGNFIMALPESVLMLMMDAGM